MDKVVFRNLEPSEMIRAAVDARLRPIIEKFPYLQNHRIQTTISMENSPVQPGPDQFTVKIRIQGTRIHSLILEKSNLNFHSALAEVAEHLLEALNRAGDRERTLRRRRIGHLDIPNPAT